MPATKLVTRTLGRMRDGERGGRAIVLLHGWGAPGDDLVPLGEALVAERTRVFVPAGPLPHSDFRRAWWHLDAADRPVHVLRADHPTPAALNPAVLAARAAVQSLLAEIHEKHGPERILLGGFSQGAMLSVDVTLALDPPAGVPKVERVFALSGVLIADALPGLRAQRGERAPAFVSHGRQDGMLPFAAGERLQQLLASAGHAITWRPFDGEHEIPPATVRELVSFLAA
jgi:phospholipase/carboxylesterase